MAKLAAVLNSELVPAAHAAEQCPWRVPSEHLFPRSSFCGPQVSYPRYASLDVSVDGRALYLILPP